MSELGLILALGCALISGVGFLCKHRGAVRAPDVAFRAPLRSAAGLFRSGWWAIGFGLAFLAWCLHVAALSMAPLSLVQAVIAGGLAMLAVPARQWFGLALGRRELIGLGLSAAGLAFLALTAGNSADDRFTGTTMLAFEGTALALGGLMILTAAHRRGRDWLLLATAAGMLLGVSDISLKALSETVPNSPLSLASPWTAIAILGGIGAFFAFARALQLGDAVAVIGRSTAFLAVIGAAALLPMVPRDEPEPAPVG